MGALLAKDEPPWYTTVTLAHTPVSFKIDSSADMSIISEATNETLQNKSKLNPVKNTSKYRQCCGHKGRF